MPFSFQEFDQKAEKAIDHIKKDLGSLRTGRATVQLLDPVVVEAYGTQMKLQEVASVQAPDATLLIVSPWDKNLMSDVEKAIAKAGLNLNPIVDGDIIRIAVPPLTEEKRLEMVKSLGRKIEEGKVMLRNIRAQVKHDIESGEGSDGVSEDDIKRDLQQLDKKLQDHIDTIEKIQASKEAELMKV